MLVLSRRPHEKIVLPTVPLSIEVLSAPPGAVRLGIDAPSRVRILRAELVPERLAGPPAHPDRPDLHQLRDRLNNLVLGLALLRLQARRRDEAAIANTLDRLEEELQALERSLAAWVRAELPATVEQP
jgi:carbon storage regulator CsrA